MDLDQISRVIQEVGTDKVEGAILLLINSDDTFSHEVFGEISFLEQVGMISTAGHDIRQNEYNDLFNSEEV